MQLSSASGKSHSSHLVFGLVCAEANLRQLHLKFAACTRACGKKGMFNIHNMTWMIQMKGGIRTFGWELRPGFFEEFGKEWCDYRINPSYIQSRIFIFIFTLYCNFNYRRTFLENHFYLQKPDVRFWDELLLKYYFHLRCWRSDLPGFRRSPREPLRRTRWNNIYLQDCWLSTWFPRQAFCCRCYSLCSTRAPVVQRNESRMWDNGGFGSAWKFSKGVFNIFEGFR